MLLASGGDFLPEKNKIVSGPWAGGTRIPEDTNMHFFQPPWTAARHCLCTGRPLLPPESCDTPAVPNASPSPAVKLHLASWLKMG